MPCPRPTRRTHQTRTDTSPERSAPGDAAVVTKHERAKVHVDKDGTKAQRKVTKELQADRADVDEAVAEVARSTT